MLTIAANLLPEDFSAMAQIEAQYYDKAYITPPNECWKWYEHLSASVFCVKDGQKVVGFLNLFPITKERFDEILSGTFCDADLEAKDIVIPRPKETLFLFLCCAAVDQAYRQSPAMTLLLEAYLRYYQQLFSQKITVSAVLCDTVTPEGTRLARRLGLLPVGFSGHQSTLSKNSGDVFFASMKQEIDRRNAKQNHLKIKQQPKK